MDRIPILRMGDPRLLSPSQPVDDLRAPSLRELGIAPTAMEAILPSYLWRFRKFGQFETATP